MKKFTINYILDENNQIRRTTNLNLAEQELYDKILKLTELLGYIMLSCEMARIKICEYTLIWYKNGNKGRLTICKSLIQ